MSQEDRPPRIVDLPHFTKDRKLSSCLQVDPAEDGGVWLSVVGNPRQYGQQETKKTTTKLSMVELAYVIQALQRYFIVGAE